MKAINYQDRRKKMLSFTLLLLVTLSMAVLVTFSLMPASRKGETVVRTVPAGNRVAPPSPLSALNTVLQPQEVMAARFATLQLFDHQYVTLLADGVNTQGAGVIQKQIALHENLFRQSLDSIAAANAENRGVATGAVLEKIIASYRAILLNRQLMSNLRNRIGMQGHDLKPDEAALLKTKNELEAKTARIFSLEAAMKELSAQKAAPAPAATETPRENSSTTTALTKQLKDQQGKIFALTAVYNSLKYDNEQLQKQLRELPKNVAGTDASGRAAAALQQRIDVLNAELRLAEVDCNIARVDAGKIISNARQRKQLLAEASGILTSLAKNPNAEVKQKVQEKIASLNQVAAKSRD